MLVVWGGISLSVVDCKSGERAELTVWFGEPYSVVVVDTEVREWSLLESESWFISREQIKAGLYSLNQMQEHLR